MIVNVLEASRLWHTAKVIIPPSWVYDRFKSIVWPFLWKGKMETISRKRYCAPLECSGLNIVSFETKCVSLRLSNFSDLRDRFSLCKWHYFARHFLGNRLAALDSRFSFSSNVILSASRPSHYYVKCLDSFRILHARIKTGFLLDNLSCRNLYKFLLDISSVMPRSAGFWGAVVDRPINWWAWVWRKSRFKLAENKNNILWLLAPQSYSCSLCP